MAEEPLAALYRALEQRATASPEIWGEDAYADFAPVTAGVIYLVYFWLGGGEIHLRTAQDAEFIIGMKVVAPKRRDAFTGAKRIAELFRNQGTQETSTPLDGGADWDITVSTKGLQIHVVEQVSGASQLYHVGHQYRFLLQRT